MYHAFVSCIRVLLFACLMSVAAGAGEVRTWEGAGTGDTNDWFDASNWQGGLLPEAGDNVVINKAKTTILLTNSTPALTSFTISAGSAANTATLIFTNWTTALIAEDIAINAYGKLTCAGPFTNAPAMSNRVWIICSNLTAALNGKIDVDYMGYAASTTSAQRASGPRGGYGGSGGAHGGYGGIGYQDPRDEVYPCDDPLYPVQPGSGGGAEAGSGAEGGAGGGAIRVEAAGHVQINGTVSANGRNCVKGQAGGGAGGSVLIACRTISGSGTIRANGGGHTAWGAPGSGGRIAIHYDPPAQSNAPAASLTFLVLPGPLDVAYDYGNSMLLADIGTVYLPDTTLIAEPINISGQILLGQTAWTTDTLTIAGRWVRFPQEGFRLTVANNLLVQKAGGIGRLEIGASCLTNFSIITTSSPWKGYRFFGEALPPTLQVGGDLTLTNGAHLMVYSAPTNGITPDYGSLVEVGGEMQIGNGCWVVPFSHWSNGASPLFRVHKLTVSTNAGFNANYAGFAGGGYAAATPGHYGFGPGGGWRANRTDYLTAGGSYGGLGGRALDDKIYGCSNAPSLSGSGGMGGNSGMLGGFGGGLIRIEARTVSLDGMLSANGGANAASWDAGGSGGSIYLTCTTFRGGEYALLRANGGAGYFAAAGGGGGRIAVWRVRDYSAGAIASAVDGSGDGQPGTIVWGWLPASGTLILLR